MIPSKYIDRFLELFTKQPLDIPLHMLFSLIICFICSWIFGLFILDKTTSCIAGFTVSMFIGIVIKEILIDKVIRHTFIDIKDICNDFIGSIIGAIMYLG